jgi:glycosyltransferase involved in cell wall biosynthesis
VRYFREANAERGAARNFGRSRSRGDYVNFFDSDDLLYPGHLEEAARMVRDHRSPEAFHLGFDEKTPAGELIRVERFEGNLDDVLVSRGNILSCNGVFVRRDIAERLPFNEDRALSGSEDYELWLRLAARYRIPCSSAVTSTVIAHPDRSTVATSKDKVLGRLAAFKAHAFNDPDVQRRFGAFRGRIELEMDSYAALYLSLCGHRRDSVKFLARILRRHPHALFTKRFAATIKHLV